MTSVQNKFYWNSSNEIPLKSDIAAKEIKVKPKDMKFLSEEL